MSARDDELKERRALMGSTNTTTYFKEAQIALGLENQGRFGQQAGIVGSVADAGSQYPRQPSGSPFAGDGVPDELPLGFSVEEQLPTGTPAEVLASELALSDPPISESATGGDELKPVRGFPGDSGDLVSLPWQGSSRSSSPSSNPTTSLAIPRRMGL